MNSNTTTTTAVVSKEEVVKWLTDVKVSALRVLDFSDKDSSIGEKIAEEVKIVEYILDKLWGSDDGKENNND